MREIKFRAWEDDAKFFVYFSLADLLFATDDYEIRIGLDRIRAMLEETSKNPSSDERIHRFTGLKDKNGREIYEGDIVKAKNWGEKGGYSLVVVEWSLVPGSDDMGTNMAGFPTMDEYGEPEVVGNIYCNQATSWGRTCPHELLEEK